MRTPCWILVVIVGACGSAAPDAQLSIRQPANATVLGTVTQLVLRADRDSLTVSQATFAPTASFVSLSSVSYGAGTVFTLDGLSSAGDSLVHGSSCTVDFEKTSKSAALYFAPTHEFSDTTGAPTATRSMQMAVALASGDVLLAGGFEGSTPVASTDRFVEASATFADAADDALTTARADGQVSTVAVGTLLSGGIGADGKALGSAELFFAESGKFVAIANDSLGARTAHRSTVLSGDRVLLSGGYDDTGATIDTTAVVSIQSDGSTQVVEGPMLTVPRAAHAALVAIGTPVIIGGYDATKQPLDSIEALSIADDGDIGDFQLVAHLQFARAEATASLLADGSILVVGGIGSDGQPRADAEVFNPITQTTRLYTLASARSGHTATTLSDGRVLIVGGVGKGGGPIATTELFVSDVGFVSEHGLSTAREGHLAVPLCDGTVLVVGGAANAEQYMPAPN